ncbi:hypothetical protein E1301_Tti012983 [Triplophysa tibetana]|uniref:Uncharacterized protein n=1 Tax=Triplophysa tibetana TaxID=1572043 RepID=A0A5A9NL05_9TELE|nr:hypothetical protein E1301_Tti012983 [Triplophysa tibetana]
MLSSFTIKAYMGMEPPVLGPTNAHPTAHAPVPPSPHPATPPQTQTPPVTHATPPPAPPPPPGPAPPAPSPSTAPPPVQQASAPGILKDPSRRGTDNLSMRSSDSDVSDVSAMSSASRLSSTSYMSVQSERARASRKISRAEALQSQGEEGTVVVEEQVEPASGSAQGAGQEGEVGGAAENPEGEGEEEEPERAQTATPGSNITKSSSVGGDMCSLGRNDEEDDDKKRRSSFGAKMAAMVGLGKKSQSTSQLDPEGVNNMLISLAPICSCRREWVEVMGSTEGNGSGDAKMGTIHSPPLIQAELHLARVASLSSASDWLHHLQATRTLSPLPPSPLQDERYLATDQTVSDSVLTADQHSLEPDERWHMLLTRSLGYRFLQNHL